MKTVVTDPEQTEAKLQDAGFDVGLCKEGFIVSLKNRKVFRAEVADVLGCETEDLGSTPNGVLVS